MSHLKTPIGPYGPPSVASREHTTPVALPSGIKGSVVTTAPTSRHAVPLALPKLVMGPHGNLIPLTGAGPTGGYTPQQLETAYGVNQVNFNGITGNGQGQTIAIVDAFDNPSFVNSTDSNFNTSALHLFDQQFGIPDPPSFTKVNQEGQAGPLPSAAPPGTWGVEIALDIEWAHAMAPAANIVLVEAQNDNFGSDGSLINLNAAAGTAANFGSVVSMSWGWNEFNAETNHDSTFNVPGVTFLAASGDSGAGTIYPSTSPNIVAVGGTTLQNLNATGDYPGTGINGEIGWNGSGGGVSSIEPEPAYQQSVQNTGFRTVPDISADADPNTGVPVLDPYDLGNSAPWEEIGGTSLATPLMAGITAIADQGRVLQGGSTLGSEQFLSDIYSLYTSSPNDFHDIINGNNGDAAGPGYDYVTGLGTPNGASFIQDLAGFGINTHSTLVSIALSPNPATVDLGLTTAFTAIGTYADGTTINITNSVTFASSDPSVASITGQGIATGHGQGSATISASLGGITSAGDSLTVVNPVSIALFPVNPSVDLGGTQQFQAIGTFADGASADVTNDVTWASATPGVATIDSHGIVSAVAGGTSVITASFAGVTSSGDTLQVVNPTSIEVSPIAPTLIVGQTEQFKAIGAFADGESFDITKLVTWISTKPNVATINAAGLATVKNAGKTSFRASVGGVISPYDTITALVPNFVVNSTADNLDLTSGQNTLRDAIFYANAIPGSTIAFDPTVFATAQTITLSLGELKLSTPGDVTIKAPSEGLTINGGGIDRVFQVELGTSAEFDGLTITGGSTAGEGGGIDVFGGTLTLNNCTITGNESGVGASYGGYGGGIANNNGTLVLAHCTVSGNIVEDNSGGGGIATEAMGANTTTTIIDSAIVNNATQGTRSGGGAVIAFGLVGGSTKLINSTLSGNTVGNDGGAISIYSSGNTLSLTNCTISGNTAVTSGGGVFAYSGAGVEINNTIIAGNTQGQPGHEFDGNYTGSNNLIGGNALLAPLGDYGGTTKTMPLLPGSPAIGAGSISLTVDAGGNPLTSDQRGESRTLNGKVDIGAFESQGFTINAVAGSTPQTALIGSAFANPLAITITGNNPNEPVNGGLVVYTATPASNGASAIFANSTILIANGQASIIAAPNNDDGWYSVVASVGGSTTTFQLTNAGATFSHLVVNTTSDSLAPGLGLLSLREAIALDNASLSGNTPITFDSIVFSQAKTITLGGSQLELSNTLGTLTITAPAAGVTISGGGVSRVFQIDSGVTVDLNGLTITDGSASGNGGAIDDEGATLSLSGVTINGNTAAGNGGGIYAHGGSISLTNCTISGNSARGNGGGVESNAASLSLTAVAVSGNKALNGGGVMTIAGTGELTNTTISGNTATIGGGGLYQDGGSLTIGGSAISGNKAKYGGGLKSANGKIGFSATTISGNNAEFHGGGITVGGSLLTMKGSTISGNTALFGAGLSNIGTGSLVIRDSSIQNNKGGGVYNTGSATFIGCTVSGNQSSGSGGGIDSISFASGISLTLVNSTISGNKALNGGGLFLIGGADLTNCTISTNASANGSGIAVGFGTVVLNNTIVSGNKGNPGTGDILGPYIGSNNLIGGNALLAPLGDYGGPTETMPLLPGSPAIGAGNLALAVDPAGNPLTTDERGLARNLFGKVDIGAFESQGFSIAIVAGSTPQTALIGNEFANTLAVAITANNSQEPVDGGIVTLATKPASSGATAIFYSPIEVISGGFASITAAPNNIVGSYSVVASVSGLSATFHLTNFGKTYANLVVNTTSDSLAPGTGLLSLREAIAFNNTNPGGNTPITFDSTVFSKPQTITLTGHQLELSNAAGTESITGPAAGLTINAGGSSRVFQIDENVTASLTGLTLTNGWAAVNGGDVFVEGGSLTLTNSIISASTAGSNGGGIYAEDATLVLTGCTVTGNSAYNGGGISAYNSITTLANTTVRKNQSDSRGGGVFLDGGAGTFTDCTVTGNTTGVSGGGIATLSGINSLSGCTISGNTSGYLGGGLYNYAPTGVLTLTGCTVSNNTASGGSLYGFGGGVFSSGPASFTDSGFTGNTAKTNGGGLFLEGTTTLTNGNVTGNTANDSGGGLFVAGETTLNACVVSGNTAFTGGGISFRGSATLNNSTLSNNKSQYGGGAFGLYNSTIWNGCTISGNSAVGEGGGLFSSASGTNVLNSCTISGNTAGSNGGGIFNYSGGSYYYPAGSNTLTNCTISGNSAGGSGGGIYNFKGYEFLTNCTVSGNTALNSGAGIYVASGYSTTLTNTIVAGNTVGGTADDIQGTGYLTGSHNLIGTGGSGGLVNEVDGNLVGVVNPGLAPLGNYGGTTETMALLPGSPAIDAGTSGSGVPTTDQRGYGRVGGVDIGAVESQGYVLTVTSGDGQTAILGKAFTNPLTVSVVANNPHDPVNGGIVRFIAPTSGATAQLSTTEFVIANGSASVTAKANNTLGAYVVAATSLGGNTASFHLQNVLQPVFSHLKSLTINEDTTSYAFTGTVAAGSTPAVGTVTITISGNGIIPVVLSTTLDAKGNFKLVENAVTLPVSTPSPYTVTYAFAAQNNFLATSNASTTLTVKPGNTVPVAKNANVILSNSGFGTVVLSGSDVETATSALIFKVTSLPSQGTLLNSDGSPVTIGETYIGGPVTLTYNSPNVTIGAIATSFQYTVTDTGKPSGVIKTSPPATVNIATPSGSKDVVRVRGTSGTDTITIGMTNNGADMQVKLNGAIVGGSIPVTSTTKVLVFGGGTNNTITIMSPSVPASLYGGMGTNTFVFAKGAWITGSMTGGGVSNTLDESKFTSEVVVDLGANTVTGVSGAMTNIQNIIGGSGRNRLKGADDKSIFNITGKNAGNVNGVAFTNFGTLSGGSGDNTFKFTASGSVTGAIVGGTGSNTLDDSALTTKLTVNLANFTAPRIGTTFSNITRVIGDGVTGSQINGPVASTNFTITGPDSGKIEGLSFKGFGSLAGGNGDDSFKFANGAFLTGFIDGGPGFNLIDESAMTTPVAANAATSTMTGIGGGFKYVQQIIGGTGGSTLIGYNTKNKFDIAGKNAGSVNSLQFVSFNYLVGGAADNTFKFESHGSITGSITGGGGTNTLDLSAYTTAVSVNLQTARSTAIGGTFSLIQKFIGGTHAGNTFVGTDASSVFNVTSANTGNVAGLSFKGFDNLVGGSGDDSFVFSKGAKLSGLVDGRGGTNTLSLSTFTTPVSINLSNSRATGLGRGFKSIQSFVGGSSATNKILGPNTSSVFDVTGANSGNVNGLGFMGFGNLVGGAGDDSFVFSDGSKLTGGISGGGGTNALDLLAYETPVSVNFTAGRSTGLGGIFASIQSFVGGTSARNVLKGPNTSSGFNITGANTGNVGGVEFSGFGNLVGGNGNDSFAFSDRATLSGSINGGAGINTLDMSSYTTAISVNMISSRVSHLGGSFSSIQSFIGGSSPANTIQGSNTGSVFNVTGANSGNVAGLYFSGFGNLSGGSGDDVFVFSDGASLTGSIKGGGGTNWLDDSAYTTAVTVNLATGKATGIGGKISKVENVRGGTGDDTLIGDSRGNILIGGAGRNTITGGKGASLLIGGTGASSVKGGSGGDLIIGGSTTYDDNNAALDAILAEWRSTGSYATRIAHLKNGGGLNGSVELNLGTTVIDDLAANVLTGAAGGKNWYFKGTKDTITNLKSGEQVN